MMVRICCSYFFPHMLCLMASFCAMMDRTSSTSVFPSSRVNSPSLRLSGTPTKNCMASSFFSASWRVASLSQSSVSMRCRNTVRSFSSIVRQRSAPACPIFRSTSAFNLFIRKRLVFFNSAKISFLTASSLLPA